MKKQVFERAFVKQDMWNEGERVMDYLDNVLNERWLGGDWNLSVKEKLFLFVKYGSVGLFTN